MKKNVRVTFLPSKIAGLVPRGISIREAAVRLGIHIEGPCGGAGNCGKDRVQIRSSGRLDTVVACKTMVNEDLEIIIPSHDADSLRIVEVFFDGKANASKITPSSSIVSTVFPHDDSSWGIALDLGTTTVAASLINLENGILVKNASILNPLVSYGHDVMSRIKYSVSHGDGLKRMHSELISSVNLLIHLLSSDLDIPPAKIARVSAAGNTTMQHIFLKKPIKSIGEYPYRAESLEVHTLPAGNLALDLDQYVPVMTFPCISAFVGGDIVAGLIAISPKNFEKPALFIDIGTNGEIALLADKKMIATSCAAGPCFEGMSIGSGMRASEGAIEAVTLGDRIFLKVIGGGQAKGICGSGLLEFISEGIRTGIINKRGRLLGKEDSGFQESCKAYLFDESGKRRFRLTDHVFVSQEDIRQVQLARAAMRTAVEFLLAEGDTKPSELKNIIIAGGFGYHLNKEAIFRVGLIPEAFGAALSFVGNSSLEGARRMLLDQSIIHRSRIIAESTSVIDLSRMDGFESRFIQEMYFG